MKTNDKIEQQKAKLIERIEKNIGRKVSGFELAEMRGLSEHIERLGIHSKSGTGSAWGLILFCEKEFYFYYPATEGMFDFFFRQNSGEGPAEDQFVRLDDLENLVIELPKKNIFSIFSPEEKFSIIVKAEKEQKELCFNLICMNKAEPVYEKLKAIL